MIKKIAKKITRRLNYTRDTNKYIKALEDIINSKNIKTEQAKGTSAVSIIIFSKDRAIQLHALLASFLELVTGDAAVYVLYTVSDKEHENAYAQVSTIFKDQTIQFIQEKDFRSDLLEVLEAIITDKLFFLVDDIIFTEPVALSDFINYSTDKFVPTLRLGANLSYAYTLMKQQPLPNFIHNLISDTDKVVWKWQDAQFDWAYPLSVDGHLFSTREIKIIIQSIDFKAPNSLEESMQMFKPIFKSRYGLAMKKSVIMNIPCNKVQTENDNIAGSTSTGYLLTKWKEGFQIDYRKLRHYKNRSAHEEVKFEFISRASKN